MSKTVLVVDDDSNIRWVLRRALNQAGYEVAMAPSGQEGLEYLANEPVDLVMLDLKMPGMDGLGTLRRIKELHQDLPVILITAYASVETAIEAMKLGAADYLGKPFDVEEAKIVVAKALEQQALVQEVRRLQGELNLQYSFDQLAGKSPAMMATIDLLKSASSSDLDMLISGEPGTGKTLSARLVHYNSQRRTLPVHVTNCAILTSQALEHELFGRTVTLAGTSAHRPGAVEKVNGGTLILDSVESLEPAMADKLAEWISNRRETAQAGSTVRIIATMTDESPRNPLCAEVSRLADATAEIRLKLPPLRDRIEDLPLLAQTFLGEGKRLGKATTPILRGYSWPRNVSELKSAFEHAMLLADDEILPCHLPEHIVAKPSEAMPGEDLGPFKLPEGGVSLEDVEKSLLVQAMSQANGNKTRAAELLGISRHTLLYRLSKYGLDSE